MEYEEVLALVEKKVALQTIKTRVAPEVAERIRKAGLAGIQIDENFKRYYPFGSLASQTIGFAGSDSQGIIGLEVTYNEYLQGIDVYKRQLFYLADIGGICPAIAGEKKADVLAICER